MATEPENQTHSMYIPPWETLHVFKEVSRKIKKDYITSHHITSHNITSHHITSHHITSHHITSHPIPSHHITSHHITSHHITSHHITSHYITLHYISLHYIDLLFAAFLQKFGSHCWVRQCWISKVDAIFGDDHGLDPILLISDQTAIPSKHLSNKLLQYYDGKSKRILEWSGWSCGKHHGKW